MNQTSFSTFINKRYKIILFGMSLVGATLGWVAMSQHGPGVTPDSVNYISVARNLINGLGFVNYSGDPMVWWPPLYSMVLALVQIIFRIDTLAAAMVLNTFFFALTIYFSGLIFFKSLKDFPHLALFGILSTVLSVSLIPIYVMVWSETLFILLVVFFFLYSENYSQKSNYFSLFVLSLIVSLACFTRYIGVVLIFCGLLGILFCKNANWKAKFNHTLIFLTISVLPLFLWLIRNYLLVGSFTGPRMLSIYSYAQNLKALVTQVIAWYLPGKVTLDRYWAVLFLIFVGGLIGLDLLSRKKPIRSFLKTTFQYWLFIISYSVFLLITCRTSFWQLIDNRYMAPVFLPLTLLLILIIAQLSAFIRKSFPALWVNAVLLVIIAICFIYPIKWNAAFIKITHDSGRQYTHERWQKNDVIVYLQEHSQEFADCSIYSNGADVIYLWTGFKTFQIPTERTGIEPDLPISSLRENWPIGQQTCLVQVDGVKRDYLFTMDELLPLLNVEKTLDFKEGAIYFATPREQNW